MHRESHSLVMCKIFQKAPPLFVIELAPGFLCVPSASFNRRLLRILFQGARTAFVYEGPSLGEGYALHMRILE